MDLEEYQTIIITGTSTARGRCDDIGNRKYVNLKATISTIQKNADGLTAIKVWPDDHDDPQLTDGDKRQGKIWFIAEFSEIQTVEHV